MPCGSGATSCGWSRVGTFAGEEVSLNGREPLCAACSVSDPVSADELAGRWPNVTVIRHDDVWTHKGVEYDGVVLDAREMSPAEVYLAASRAAHELVVVAPPSAGAVAVAPG